MDALFGIHVGNSSACLAIWKDEDRVEVVVNDGGDRVTPTAVQMTPPNSTTGWGAEVERFKKDSYTIVRNKQLLNEEISDSELEYLKSLAPYTISKSGDHFKYDLVHEREKYSLSPQDVLEIILKKMIATAKSAVGGNKELNAVICVPLHFSLSSIEKVKQAVKNVGFNVLQVIDEPSSAALGAGLGCIDDNTSYHCLVYRVGGATLDATVLLVQDCIFSVMGSVHKYDLGGVVFTEKLAEFLGTEFKRMYKTAELTERSMSKLCAAAENVKQILSIQNAAQCNVESIGGGYDLNCSITRARFESIIARYLTDFIDPVQEVLQKASLSKTDIKKVILCGGSLKMPKLQEKIRNFLTSAEIVVSSTPDETISMGAAKQAGYCSKYQLIPTELAIDIPCLSEAIVIKIKSGNEESDSTFTIPQNSLLPLKRQYEVNFKENCETVEVELITGKDVHQLGITELDELDPLYLVADISKDGSLALTLESEAGLKKKYFEYDLKLNTADP